MAEYIVQGESLTPLANKIRAIQGKTDNMTLGDMDTNLDTIKNDINNAFVSIGNKGGTIPSSKISGNLASAIESIPTDSTGSTGPTEPTDPTGPTGGTEVKRFEGTFTTMSEPKDVVCGFKPDAVVFTVDGTFEGYKVQSGVFFTEHDCDMCYCALALDVVNYELTKYVQIVCNRTENGFTPSGIQSDYDTTTIKYTAIKYT